MKNTRTMTSILVCVFLLMLGACKPSQEKEGPGEGDHDEKKERVKPPKQIISLKESKSLYDNYTKNRVELIEDFERQQHPDKDFEAARYTAFDYSAIKQYIAFIEQEADSAGVDISTLRLYFANYPKEEKFPDGKEVVHPRQNSIFIVPTIKVDGRDFGFYIGADGKAKLIKDAAQEKGMGSTEKDVQKSYASFVPNFSAATFQGGQSLNFNRGNAGPPPPDDY